METLNHRPLYLGEFVRSLLRNHKAKDDQDLIEAEDLVEELKQLQPDHLNTLVLQVEVARARNQFEKALDLIQTAAQRLDLAPLAIKKLAELGREFRSSSSLPNNFIDDTRLCQLFEMARSYWLCFSVGMITLKRHSTFVSRSGRTLVMPR